MITITVTWLKDPKRFIMGERELQDKTFKDLDSAVEWVRRNSSHIVGINDSYFAEHLISNTPIHHFKIIEAIKKGSSNA